MNLLEQSDLNWTHSVGGANFDYPIEVWNAVLSSRADGHMDLLVRWAPNAYCHFHRHLAHTTSTVLEGELHVTDMKDGEPGATRIRKPGDYASKDAGDLHMERGGPEGALVLFNFHAPDGRLFDVLARDGATLATTTIASMTKA
jgi:quercetin dioxygenase-like cupin family protein